MASTPCLGCGTPLLLRDELAGRQVRCPRCQHVFTVPEPAPEGPPVVEEVAPPQTPPRLPPMDDGSKMRRRRRRRRMSLLLSLGIVAGVLVLGCGGFGAFIYIVYIHGTEETVTAADRDMVITAERLARYAPGANWDFSQGTINKVRHLDGSRELTYEYTTPDEAPKPLYISCTVVIEPKLEDARVSYTGLSVGTQIGFKLQRESELKEVERNDLWKWGDESRCVLLTSNGSPVGNVFQARKGRRLFHILIVGVYFQDPAAIRELLAPIVQRLDSYNG